MLKITVQELSGSLFTPEVIRKVKRADFVVEVDV